MTNRIESFDNNGDNFDGDLTGGIESDPNFGNAPEHVKGMLEYLCKMQKTMLRKISKVRPDVFAFRLLVCPNGVHRLWKVQKAGDAWSVVGDIAPPWDVSKSCVDVFEEMHCGGMAMSAVHEAAMLGIGKEPADITEDDVSSLFGDHPLDPENVEGAWDDIAGEGKVPVAGSDVPGDLIGKVVADAKPDLN